MIGCILIIYLVEQGYVFFNAKRIYCEGDQLMLLNLFVCIKIRKANSTLENQIGFAVCTDLQHGLSRVYILVQ